MSVKQKLFLPLLALFTLFMNGGAAFTAVSSASCGDKCHIIKPYAESADNPQMLAGLHKAAEIGCTDCHEYTEETLKEEEELYVKGEYDDPPYTREYENDFCFRCHGSYPEIRDMTKEFAEKWGRNPHESHMGEIGCYECHKAHQASKFVCAECHHANWQERLPEGWKTE